MPPDKIDHHQPVLSERSMVQSPRHIPTITNYITDEWSVSTWHTSNQPPPSTPSLSPHHGIQVHHQTRSITALECISKFTQSQPSSITPHSPGYRLQVPMIWTSKCISRLTQSQPRSPSVSSTNYGLHMYIQTHLMTASLCVSKLTQSHPPSVSVYSFNYGLQVHTIMASQVHLQAHLTMASQST